MERVLTRLITTIIMGSIIFLLIIVIHIILRNADENFYNLYNETITFFLISMAWVFVIYAVPGIILLINERPKRPWNFEFDYEIILLYFLIEILLLIDIILISIIAERIFSEYTATINMDDLILKALSLFGLLGTIFYLRLMNCAQIPADSQ